MPMPRRAKVTNACTRDRATVATVVRVGAEVLDGGTVVAVQAASVAATRTATRTRDRIVVISFPYWCDRHGYTSSNPPPACW